MNIAKNMEAIFLAATLIVATTGFASAMPTHHKAAAAKADDGVTHVVVVKAKRLSAAEKAHLSI